jgi:hypothetical protein
MKVIWDSTEDLALQDIMNRVNQENGKSWKPQTMDVLYQNAFCIARNFYPFSGSVPAKIQIKFAVVFEL